jgi:hypothetical protein
MTYEPRNPVPPVTRILRLPQKSSMQVGLDQDLDADLSALLRST